MKIGTISSSTRYGRDAARWHTPALIVLFLVFAFRVVNLTTTYMRDDEEIAFRTTAQGLEYAIWYQAEQDVHAPVWFASFWAWQQVAGSTEFSGRVYSLLLSTLALALLYQIGRRWFGYGRYGVFAMAVVGVNAYAHIYSLEIRPYALGLLLATANMLLFRRWFVRPTLRRALAYGVSVALMLWTHYFLAFLVLAQVVYTAVGIVWPRALTPGPSLRISLRLITALRPLRTQASHREASHGRGESERARHAVPLHGESTAAQASEGQRIQVAGASGQVDDERARHAVPLHGESTAAQASEGQRIQEASASGPAGDKRARHAVPLRGDSIYSRSSAERLVGAYALPMVRLWQGMVAGLAALLLWLPWLPVFIGQVRTLREIEMESGAFRGLGIGNTTEPTTWDTVWRLVLHVTNGQPLLYALPLFVGLALVKRRGSYTLALTWMLVVPAINLLVNLVASVYTPRYLSYVSFGVALAVGAGLAALPRLRWPALLAFCAVSLWALPSQLPTDRIPLRDIFQTISVQSEPGDVIYFTRASDAGLFTRWHIDHYLSAELRANQVDRFEAALDARAVWFVTGDFFDPQVQDRFHALEATHPLDAVVGDCNPRWCYLAQRLVGPPADEGIQFGDGLIFNGVDAVSADPSGVTARLWWRVDGPLEADYSVSLQLLDAQGLLVAQQDGPLNPDAETPLQTSALEAGRVYTDTRTLTPVSPLTPGAYQLVLVVYQPWDNIRLTLQSGSDTLGVRAVTVP